MKLLLQNIFAISFWCKYSASISSQVIDDQNIEQGEILFLFYIKEEICQIKSF